MYSWHRYGASADGKLHRIHRNSAETPRMKNTAKQAILVEKGSAISDRRVAVAPMMDWTDEGESAKQLNDLLPPEESCRLYVSSNFE